MAAKEEDWYTWCVLFHFILCIVSVFQMNCIKKKKSNIETIIVSDRSQPHFYKKIALLRTSYGIVAFAS